MSNEKGRSTKNNAGHDSSQMLSPRDILSLRLSGNLESSKATLKALNYNNIEAQLSPVLASLNFLQQAFEKDLDAAYEFGRIGGHQVLLKMMETYEGHPVLLDSIGQVVDACTLHCSKFPMRSSTTVNSDERRIPLKITLDVENEKGKILKEILIRTIPKETTEIASSDKANFTVGYYLWDGSIVLSYWLTKNPQVVKNKKVFEIGCGAGLTGIVASAYASSTILCDFNPKIVENANFNISLNSMKHHSNNPDIMKLCCIPDGEEDTQAVPKCIIFDWEDEDFSVYAKDGLERASMDVILGADVVCQESDCYNIARVLKFFLNKDSGAGYFIIGSKDHRFGAEKFEDIMRSENLNVEVMDTFINNNDEYKSFLAEHNHFNARPLDKLCMYKVLARNSFGVAR